MKPSDYWKQVREVCDEATAGPWFPWFTDVGKWTKADAAFIALARTALPEALDEIERLRTALERAVDLLIIVPRYTDDEDKIDEVAVVIHAALGKP